MAFFFLECHLLSLVILLVFFLFIVVMILNSKVILASALILLPSLWIIWFKGQKIHLIFFINTSGTTSMYVTTESAPYITRQE